MPELPEVETVCNNLSKYIIGQKILSAIKYRDKIRCKIPENIGEILSSQYVTKVARRAKFILIYLSNHYVLVFHLGMSGKILLFDEKYKIAKHDHFVMKFTDMLLVFNDPRRFGLVDLCLFSELDINKNFVHLGLEPFANNFNKEYLKEKFKNKKSPIKTVMMDSKIVVGIGNIYASEILFRCNINPILPANKLSKPKLDLLVQKIQEVLDEAIKKGGSTLRDYVQADGNKGQFQDQFKVYGKEGNGCHICKSSILKIVQAGRATFYCPKCQKF